MSRIAKNPVVIPEKVEVNITNDAIIVKGPLGELKQELTGDVEIKKEDTTLTFETKKTTKFAKAMSGTIRSLVQNMVTGVSAGFERKLTLIGVGYKATVQGNKINLELGFSHPVNHQLPDGVTAQTSSPTEIILKSSSKQMIGQVAAEIRAYRPPEPYKGKGVRYLDEYVAIKEAKKT
jgi:large subunit ribosomal protein L6